jgi:hypothetical protein
MMKEVMQRLTLDRPATYQIKVPGELDERWTDWNGEMAVTVTRDRAAPPVTTLLCRVCYAGFTPWAFP